MFGKAVNKATSNPTGLAILYFKADTLVTDHSAGTPDTNIYDVEDNYTLYDLPKPGTSDVHPLSSDYEPFYEATTNPNFTTPVRPYRAESFILMSAGRDGLYGTADDVFNFEKEK
jgi:hypothetical protein